VPEPAKSPVELTAADFTALRWFAGVEAGILTTAWVILDDARAQLRITAFVVAGMVATMALIYLLRRRRNRR
jgi:hypothetical protein